MDALAETPPITENMEETVTTTHTFPGLGFFVLHPAVGLSRASHPNLGHKDNTISSKLDALDWEGIHHKHEESQVMRNST